MHQRVADLNETLWGICDTKKAESEKERESVMHNGWLPDKTGIVTNHYITLMQAELDRFQDTARMLKDYYRCMADPVPGELPAEYQRLPLLDLKNADEVFFFNRLLNKQYNQKTLFMHKIFPPCRLSDFACLIIKTTNQF